MVASLGIQWAQSNTIAPSGLKKITDLLRPCLNKAVSEGVIHKNPCDDVLLPKESCIETETKKQFSLSDTEISQMRDASLSRYKTTKEYRSRDAFVLLLIINLGLRVGEAVALEWSDIDFNNRLIYIRKILQSNIMKTADGEGGKKVYSRIKKSSKTSAGVRILQLNKEVVWYLNELKEYDKRNNIQSQYIACTNVGTRNTPRNLQRSLDRLIRNTTIDKNVTLHTLRHTFGSTLLRRGIRIEVVSKLMGHANISVTYNKYIHTIKEEEAKAMNMVKVC